MSEKSSVSFFDSISDKDFDDFNEYLYDLMDIVFTEDLVYMSKPNFIEIVADHIKSHFQIEWFEQNLCDESELEEIEDYIDEFLEFFIELLEPILPKRQYSDSVSATENRTTNTETLAKITQLKNLPQPQQRTQEWYELRHNLLTASNIYKLLGSESQQNSIIYEKCKPLVLENRFVGGYVNPNDARQKGIMYEPVSIKIYEHKNQTKVDDFGCIQHPKYPCIGASPDGINIDPDAGMRSMDADGSKVGGLRPNTFDPQSNRFGRMLEVKNIVNREINGIPKEEYWIQMQIQMETCDLDECDFLETRFKEFESSDAFYESDEKYRGVFLCFIENNGEQKYEYMSVLFEGASGIERKNVETWIGETVAKNTPIGRNPVFRPYYWYLDEYSCVLVKRNQLWFQAALPKILDTWKIIESERQTGYEHRAAKKRTPTLNPLINAEVMGTNHSFTEIRKLP